MPAEIENFADAPAAGANCGPFAPVPVPARFWWLKRLLAAGGCLLIGLVALRLWWGWEAHRRYNAAIERYRQAGGPVFAAEFDAQLDAVPDEDNAAVLLEQAIQGITPTTKSGVSLDDFLNDPELFEKDIAAARELTAANANVLRLVRQACARPQVAWSPRLQGYPANFNIGILSGQRQLGKLLWFSAIYQHKIGSDAETIATLHDLASFSEVVEAHPILISNLVAWAIANLGSTAVQEISPLWSSTVLNYSETTRRRPRVEVRSKSSLRQL